MNGPPYSCYWRWRRRRCRQHNGNNYNKKFSFKTSQYTAKKINENVRLHYSLYQKSKKLLFLVVQLVKFWRKARDKVSVEERIVCHALPHDQRSMLYDLLQELCRTTSSAAFSQFRKGNFPNYSYLFRIEILFISAETCSRHNPLANSLSIHLN